jgi:hypothetical protein
VSLNKEEEEELERELENEIENILAGKEKNKIEKLPFSNKGFFFFLFIVNN